MRANKKSGFTVLELMIVVVVVGVLASLALPKFYSMVERSRSVEAINALSVVRNAIEQCRQANGGINYDPANCVVLQGSDFVIKNSGYTLQSAFLGVNAHFSFNGSGISGGSPFQWLLYVQRNSYENNSDPGSPAGLNCPFGAGAGASPNSMIGLCIDESAGTIDVVGSGYYEGL
jgi:prepilin-type N-terminal cleavage/methylation domain-containing protein